MRSACVRARAVTDSKGESETGDPGDPGPTQRLTNTGQHPRKEDVVGLVSQAPAGTKRKGREAAKSESITRAKKKVLRSVDGLTCSFVLAGASECRTRRRSRTAQTNRAGWVGYGYNEETVERRFRSGDNEANGRAVRKKMRPKPRDNEERRLVDLSTRCSSRLRGVALHLSNGGIEHLDCSMGGGRKGKGSAGCAVTRALKQF